MSFGFDKGAELPATPVYMELLREARTPEEVAALIDMHEGDVAEREALIAECEADDSAGELVIMQDGLVATAGLVNAMQELGQEASGCYRNGRRA